MFSKGNFYLYKEYILEVFIKTKEIISKKSKWKKNLHLNMSEE